MVELNVCNKMAEANRIVRDIKSTDGFKNFGLCSYDLDTQKLSICFASKCKSEGIMRIAKRIAANMNGTKKEEFKGIAKIGKELIIDGKRVKDKLFFDMFKCAW